MSQHDPKQFVYLVDASIYIFRAWFTMPDTLTNDDGDPVNAVMGFADFLLNFLERETPEYMACAFDKSLSMSYRNEIYPDYKANRDPAPPELKRQFEYCRELVRAAGIAEFASERYEADDIIGTLSHNMRQHGLNSCIITGDKDLTQLLEPSDAWWEYAKNKRMKRNDVMEQFGVYPEQIADLLALAGDSVDNIPGIPGIGMKTAAHILKKFGTLENALANAEQVGTMKFRGAKRAQVLLQEHQDTARLSKQLTEIAHDKSMPTEQAALLRKPHCTESLDSLFNRLGFGNFRRNRWQKVLSQ